MFRERCFLAAALLPATSQDFKSVCFGFVLPPRLRSGEWMELPGLGPFFARLSSAST